MPNWCSISYCAEGDAQEQKALYDLMKKLENMPEPGLHENGFGSSWLGQAIIALGGNWETVYCRGYWYDLTENPLSFSVLHAWCEADEFRHFIEQKFPKLKLYFTADEQDNLIFQTNDKDGHIFPDKYYFYLEDSDTNYYASLETLIKDIEALTGEKDLATFEDCDKAMERYSKEHKNICYNLCEYEYIDD